MSTQETHLRAIADAIRYVDGTEEPIQATTFDTRIRALKKDFYMPLTVKVEAGAVVTVTNGETTMTATSGSDGYARFLISKPGYWGVSATKGDETSDTTMLDIPGEFTTEIIVGIEIVYHGTTPNTLSVSPTACKAASTTNHAIIGSVTRVSSSSSYTYTGYTDVYDKSLAHTTATGIGRREAYVSLSALGLAFFVGGFYHGKSSTTTYEYDVAYTDVFTDSLTKTSPAILSKARRNVGAATVGDYALFAGGYYKQKDKYSSSYFTMDVSTVEAMTVDMVRTLPSELSLTQQYGIGVSIGDYAIFTGNSKAVDAYDRNLTRTTAEVLRAQGSYLSATPAGNYALFSGEYSSGATTYVDVITSDLTRTTADDLSVARYRIGATTLRGFAVFCGGYDGTNVFKNVDVYSGKLVHFTPTEISTAAMNFTGTSVGNYALFARPGTTTVEVYTAE